MQRSFLGTRSRPSCLPGHAETGESRGGVTAGLQGRYEIQSHSRVKGRSGVTDSEEIPSRVRVTGESQYSQRVTVEAGKNQSVAEGLTGDFHS